jgi:hypothetical protein
VPDSTAAVAQGFSRQTVRKILSWRKVILGSACKSGDSFRGFPWRRMTGKMPLTLVAAGSFLIFEADDSRI